MKVVNVHRPREDSEIYYLVRLTPQELKPLLPKGMDADKVPEGFAWAFWGPQFDEPVDRNAEE